MMSDKGAKAERYARAAFQALIERWREDFASVSETLSQDQDLYSRLMDGSRPYSERESDLETVLPPGAPPEFVNLLKLLVQEGDLDLLPALPAALSAVATSHRQPIGAAVTSAVELTEEERESIRSTLMDEFGSELVFTFNVDPTLMGGLRVRVGDRLIDTSVARRLSTLREQITSLVR
jgi:F-type H+-transporting ATPase subunit delta